MSADRRGGDDLRRLLERGDPAGDGRGPSGDDWARMKRAMLSASSDAPAAGRFGYRLVLAATVAALALIVIRVAWVERRGTTGVTPLPPATAHVEPEPVLPVPVPAPAVAQVSKPVPAAPHRRPPHRTPRADREPRTVHFVTANGTQIVWTLDPNFDL